MKDRIHKRDEMYNLSREGLSVDGGKLNGKVGKVDRPHIFDHGDGEIRPASLLRSEKRIGAFRSRSLSLGSSHSHPGGSHEHHCLENVPEPQRDLLGKFRKASRRHRDLRRQSRDR